MLKIGNRKGFENNGLIKLFKILHAQKNIINHGVKVRDVPFWKLMLGTPNNFNDFLLKPSKNFNEALWCDEWDNVQHVVASILTGDANASIIINKLASSRYSGKTKLAFMQFNSNRPSVPPIK